MYFEDIDGEVKKLRESFPKLSPDEIIADIKTKNAKFMALVKLYRENVNNTTDVELYFMYEDHFSAFKKQPKQADITACFKLDCIPNPYYNWNQGNK